MILNTSNGNSLTETCFLLRNPLLYTFCTVSQLCLKLIVQILLCGRSGQLRLFTWQIHQDIMLDKRLILPQPLRQWLHNGDRSSPDSYMLEKLTFWCTKSCANNWLDCGKNPMNVGKLVCTGGRPSDVLRSWRTTPALSSVYRWKEECHFYINDSGESADPWWTPHLWVTYWGRHTLFPACF